jgi:hypothetical protein
MSFDQDPRELFALVPVVLTMLLRMSIQLINIPTSGFTTNNDQGCVIL